MTTQQTAARKKTLLVLLLVAALAAGVAAYMTYNGTPERPESSPADPNAGSSSPMPAQTPQMSGAAAHIAVDPQTTPESQAAPQTPPQVPAADPVPPGRMPELPLPDSPPEDPAPAVAEQPQAESPALPAEPQAQMPGAPSAGEAPATPIPDTGEEAKAAGKEPGVIYYEKVQTNKEGTAARGDISERTPVVGAAPSGRSGIRDPLVTEAFSLDLARFLVDNYWPAGSHPQARRAGIITTDLKWTNMRYGGRLQGFSADRSAPAEERRRVLNYVYLPSMIRSLYTLHVDDFFLNLEQAVISRIVEPEQRRLTNAQAAELCSLYAGMASGLSGAVTAYGRIPIRNGLIEAYTDAAAKADAAYMALTESMQNDGVPSDSLARRYQTAVILRDQQKENLAAAMRKNGNVGRLDSTTLVYAAMWLNRRGDEKAEANHALAEILADAGRRFALMGQNYKALPPKKPVSPIISSAPAGLR